jgi:hypothetical protein
MPYFQNSDFKYFLQDYYINLFDYYTNVSILQDLVALKADLINLNKLEDKINNKNNLKLNLFSSHDTTLFSLFKSLNIAPLLHQIEFYEELSFVLYEVDDEFYTLIKHNDHDITVYFCEVRSFVNMRNSKVLLRLLLEIGKILCLNVKKI